MTDTRKSDDGEKRPRLRVAKSGRAIPAVKTITAVTSAASAGLFALAAPNLIDAQTGFDFAKVAVMTISVGAVAWGTTTLALERLAPLAAAGSRTSLVVSVSAIALIGAGLAISTFGGLTRNEVAIQTEKRHGVALGAYVNAVYGDAIKAHQLAPVLRANSADLESHVSCERKSSCVSKSGNGGDGPMARSLQVAAERSIRLSDEIAQSEEALKAGLRQVNEELVRFRKTAEDRTLSASERNLKLQEISNSVLQYVRDLEETSPAGLINAYLEELETPKQIAGNAVGTRNLNALTRQYAGNIRSVLEEQDLLTHLPPSFPAKVGVSETLKPKWLTYFLPLTLLLIVLELVWPLTIWFSSYRLLKHQIDIDEPRDPEPPQTAPFDVLRQEMVTRDASPAMRPAARNHKNTRRGNKSSRFDGGRHDA